MDSVAVITALGVLVALTIFSLTPTRTQKCDLYVSAQATGGTRSVPGRAAICTAGHFLHPTRDESSRHDRRDA